MTDTRLNVNLDSGAIFAVQYDDDGIQFDLYEPDPEHSGPIPAPDTDPAYTRRIGYEVIAADMIATFEPPSSIPPADQRPVCVTVGFLADNPEVAAKLEYLDGYDGRWRPASAAIGDIDAGWPVEVREAQS